MFSATLTFLSITLIETFNPRPMLCLCYGAGRDLNDGYFDIVKPVDTLLGK